MAKADELEELAQRYLDLFEGEFSAAAGDPLLGETLDRLSQIWFETAQATWTLAPRIWNGVTADFPAGPPSLSGGEESKSNDARAADGSASPSTASGSRGAELAALRRSLEELEKQLAELEASPRGKPELDQGDRGGRS